MNAYLSMSQAADKCEAICAPCCRGCSCGHATCAPGARTLRRCRARPARARPAPWAWPLPSKGPKLSGWPAPTAYRPSDGGPDTKSAGKHTTHWLVLAQVPGVPCDDAKFAAHAGQPQPCSHLHKSARARACEMGVHWRERPGQPEHGYRRSSGREHPAKRVGRTKRVRMPVARDAHVHGEVCVRLLRLPSEPGGVCGGAKPADAVVNTRACGLYRFTCLPGALAQSHACTASDSDEHRRNGVGSATAPRGPASQRR
jgi:hypothetical protein